MLDQLPPELLTGPISSLLSALDPYSPPSSPPPFRSLSQTNRSLRRSFLALHFSTLRATFDTSVPSKIADFASAFPDPLTSFGTLELVHQHTHTITPSLESTVSWLARSCDRLVLFAAERFDPGPVCRILRSASDNNKLGSLEISVQFSFGGVWDVADALRECLERTRVRVVKMDINNLVEFDEEAWEAIGRGLVARVHELEEFAWEIRGQEDTDEVRVIGDILRRGSELKKVEIGCAYASDEGVIARGWEWTMDALAERDTPVREIALAGWYLREGARLPRAPRKAVEGVRTLCVRDSIAVDWVVDAGFDGLAELTLFSCGGGFKTLLNALTTCPIRAVKIQECFLDYDDVDALGEFVAREGSLVTEVHDVLVNAERSGDFAAWFEDIGTDGLRSGLCWRKSIISDRIRILDITFRGQSHGRPRASTPFGPWVQSSKAGKQCGPRSVRRHLLRQPASSYDHDQFCDFVRPPSLGSRVESGWGVEDGVVEELDDLVVGNIDIVAEGG
ncbi:hypothetical protein BJ742DRAFT_743032 [Cladochytrium replicatum]|nr:hypothetical protein BJ742DRAFT_743032 [Cladochytrium replicatum]